MLAPPEPHAGERGRLTFSPRASRFGVKLTAPPFSRLLRVRGVLEVDYYGGPPAGVTESQLFASPAPRLRHAVLELESPYVDVLAGKSWYLFSWQGVFHPSTVEIQGVPGQVFGRAPQLRVSRTLKTSALALEVALAASRPPQRDARAPDAQAGVKFVVDHCKGLRTAGGTATSLDALTLGISGVARRLSILEPSASPARSWTRLGWGISLDALLPIIPASEARRGRALTASASFVTGTGIADLYSGLTGGVATVPGSANAQAAPNYAPNIDPGIVTFGSDGAPHTIDWRSILVGLQYYFPPAAKVWLSLNYSHFIRTTSPTTLAAPLALASSPAPTGPI